MTVMVANCFTVKLRHESRELARIKILNFVAQPVKTGEICVEAGFIHVYQCNLRFVHRQNLCYQTQLFSSLAVESEAKNGIQFRKKSGRFGRGGVARPV
jgi:hypothetical protein